MNANIISIRMGVLYAFSVNANAANKALDELSHEFVAMLLRNIEIANKEWHTHVIIEEVDDDMFGQGKDDETYDFTLVFGHCAKYRSRAVVLTLGDVFTPFSQFVSKLDQDGTCIFIGCNTSHIDAVPLSQGILGRSAFVPLENILYAYRLLRSSPI
jgi:hypothetical protein